MDRLERFYKIDHLLKERSVVSFQLLLEELEVSDSTLKRDLEFMRSRFNAPIEYDREKNGYRFVAENRDGPRYELPGLWFNATETYALLTMQHLLQTIEPGLLGKRVRPLQDRLRGILGSNDHSLPEVQRRIRILHMTSRKAHLKHFETVAAGVLRRRRLHIRYLVRSRNEETERVVSPQRLVHYRDNWYLDAWCHLRKDVRSFAVDAVLYASLLSVVAKRISDQELDEILASGYGIFSGKKTTLATLKFAPERARWVSVESWHPEQQSRLETDGSYTLEFPYSDDRELIGDILRYGPHVQVLNPPSSRDRVVEQLRLTADRYQ
jgi:predicted DNA-binding transcriptional regulator YafY